MNASETIDMLYRTYRTFALSIAYRMLGVVSDAEDIVQDLFAELQSKEFEEINNIKAYIARSVTNRCLNLLHSSSRTREQYIGEWLPEPIMESMDNPDIVVERKDTISYAYVVLLHRLTPDERAVFLLREVFEYDYADISEMLEKSAANCRKIFSRAKQKINQSRPEDNPASYPDESDSRRDLIMKFVYAFENFDRNTLLSLLEEDAIMFSDGGGVVRAAIHPISSRKRIMTLLTSIKAFKDLREKWELNFVEMNREWNVIYSYQGVVKAAFCLELNHTGELIHHLYVVMNPEKLKNLNPNGCHPSY